MIVAIGNLLKQRDRRCDVSGNKANFERLQSPFVSNQKMKFVTVILTVFSVAFAVPHGFYGGVVGSQQGLPEGLVEVAGGIDRPPRSPPSPIIGAPPGLRISIP
jgi:hypothetical protein